MTQSSLSPFIGIPLALVAGTAIPLQGRINGALGTRLDDGLAAALVSFGTGLALMTVISLALPRGRAGFRRIAPAVRQRKFPPVYLAAGAIGAFFVFSQSLTIGLLGVALFTVATVMGQTLSGLLVDRMGLGPAGKRSATPMRIIGVLLTVEVEVDGVEHLAAGGRVRLAAAHDAALSSEPAPARTSPRSTA